MKIRSSVFNNDSGKWLFRLALVYIAGTAARYVIGLFMSQAPFVMPDEALYANIARSIVSGGGIALRGQPVTYTNLLYPLLISPFYALFPAGDQFRAIQFFNCFVMNLAVFPAYGIAKKFTGEKPALFIAVISILLPDMLMAQRIMTEAIEYPLFLFTAYLMYGLFSAKVSSPGMAALTGASAFLLTQAKGGNIALAAVFFAMLMIRPICRRFADKRNGIPVSRSFPLDCRHALVFAGVFAALCAVELLALLLSGMDFSQPTIYQTQLQAPALDHLKKTLPGLLLYAFFIPVAFGIYPLLLPASNIRRYGEQKSFVLLALIALALTAAGACYMFFDTETIGDYFAGRIHIRYVFMYLPLFLAFSASPKLEGAKPNGKLLACLGFILAMTVTVSFGALLSERRYPVDAISLSYIIYDDPALNWRLLSQAAMLTFALGMLALLWRRGWSKATKRVCAAALILGLVTASWLGYGLNDWNNNKALAADSKQAARMLSGQTALLVPDSGIYFDNTLSVLDTAMEDAPFAMMYDDVCASLGEYGALVPVTPPKYWTEKPANTTAGVARAVLTPGAFTKMVLAQGASVQYTDRGLFAIVTPSPDGRLFHSALAGITESGVTGKGAVLYVYDEQLLSKGSVRVYLKVKAASAARLSLSSSEQGFYFDLGARSGWIYADFTVPEGSAQLKVYIITETGSPAIETYKVE